MPPETLEFVEVLLDLTRPVPRPSVFHQFEDEFFHGERRLTPIKGAPHSGPVQRQSSEAEDVAVSGDAAAIRRIDVTDKPQKPHQREERVASDPPGAEGAVELEARIVLEEGLRSRRHAEIDVAVRGSDSDQRIEKRVCAHDIPTGPIFLNQHRLREARVQIGLCRLDLDTAGFLHDVAHAAMLFPPQRVAVLRKAPFQVFRFSNVNQLVLLVVNEVDARRAWKRLQEFHSEFQVEISDGHGPW